MGTRRPTPNEDTSPMPELSSIQTALSELARRVALIAEQSTGEEAEHMASQLHAVERALTEARRRLEALTK